MALTKHYSVSELKSKILQPAFTSVYMIDITSGAQKFGDFLNFRGLSGVDYELINLSCSEASLPGVSLATHEATSDYAGVTEKMAYRKISDETLDLTFYVDSNYKVIEFLNAWVSYIVGEGSTFGRDDYLDRTAYYRMNWPNTYKANISVTKFEKTNKGPQVSLTYDFVDAFPLNIISSPISYEASQLLKVTASFAYTRHVMKRSSTSASTLPQSIPQSPQEQAFYNGSGNPEFNYDPNLLTQDSLREDYAAWALSNQSMIEKFGRKSADPNNDQKLILNRALTQYPPGTPQYNNLRSKYKF